MEVDEVMALELLMTEDELNDTWFKFDKMRMGPPEEDGLYHIVLEFPAPEE